MSTHQGRSWYFYLTAPNLCHMLELFHSQSFLAFLTDQYYFLWVSMAHRTSVITFFLSSKHIIIYDNMTLACLKMVSLVCNGHLLHLAWLWYQTGFYVEHESTMADPGEGPGGPSSPLFLVQTEAQGAEKNFFGDQAPLIARSGSGTEVWCLMIIIHVFYKWVNKTQVCSVSSSVKPWREWLKRDCLQFSTG